MQYTTDQKFGVGKIFEKFLSQHGYHYLKNNTLKTVNLWNIITI